MQLSGIEETLRGMIDAETLMSLPPPARKPGLSRFFRRRDRKPAAASRSVNRRSDLIVAGMGIALGLSCAVFPWYIFFNQEKFGVRAMKFGGGGLSHTMPLQPGSHGRRIGEPVSDEDMDSAELDLFATGTLPRSSAAPTLPAAEQPFPGDPPAYRMVFASAGRAMIADDSGLWVVQRGSLLPDNSTVARIEQDGDRWVLVTSADRTIELSAK